MPQNQIGQFPPYRLSVTDDLRSGNACAPDRTRVGVPLTGAEAQSVAVFSLGAPVLASANSVAASQSVGLGANFVLNGAVVTNGVAVFDVPRNVVAAWTTASVLTIRGYDQYGQYMVEVSASAQAHTGAKAFKRIISITSSAAITGATVGSGSVLGLPYRPVPGGFISMVSGEQTAETTTYVPPIRTTSTGTSVDVRGTVATATTAFNGAIVFKVRMAVANGPADADAFGIPQYIVG